jgi:hypothetical protein
MRHFHARFFARPKKAGPGFTIALPSKDRFAVWHGDCSKSFTGMSEIAQKAATASLLPRTSHILRAIGQEIQRLHIGSFDLRVEDGNYILKGRESRNQEVLNTGSKISLLRPWIRSEETKSTIIELRFTPQDITFRSLEVMSKRDISPTTPDAFSLPELMRTVGYYIDQKQAHLQRLTRRGEILLLDYQTAEGTEVHERNPISFYYDLFVQMYLQRSGRQAGEIFFKRNGIRKNN